MGLQRYRADSSRTQKDGAVVWRSEWMGGPSLAKITNCRLEKLAGDMRATVYITGDADTYFSQPAVCVYMGCKLKGYVTNAEDGTGDLVFRHVYYS